MTNKTLLELSVWLAVSACTGSSDQIITGRIAAGFPTQASSVRVVQHGTVVASSRLAADGSFRIAVPTGSGLALQVVSAGKDKLVFPRQGATTTIATTFSARPGGIAFELGAIHYVGTNFGSVPIVFHNGPASQTDCEDGHDANGAVCIDDEDTSSGSCAPETETEGGGGGNDLAGSDDVDDGLAQEGDAVADHNFPADGCADDGGESGGSSD